MGASGKLRVLDRLLVKLHARGHRCVVFSQFAHMLDLLDDYCRLRGFSFVRLTGSTNRVQRMVNLQARAGSGGARRRASTPLLLLTTARARLRLHRRTTRPIPRSFSF